MSLFLNSSSLKNKLFQNGKLALNLLNNVNFISSESKKRYIPTSGTYPLGFKAGGVHCGLKKNNIKDLALIQSEYPCTGAGIFTTNAFKAAPVVLDRELLSQQPDKKFLGILINSGCANACTGLDGLKDAREVSKTVTKCSGTTNPSMETLVMSTGVIGKALDMDKIKSGISALFKKVGTSHDSWMEAATSIMTTDTIPKLLSNTYRLRNGCEYRIAGLCKGAGMIHPNMATMLSTIYTDARVSQECLQKALNFAAQRSFNAISVDGDMSTNDSFCVLANGAAMTGKYADIIIDDPNSEEYLQFQQALTDFATELSKLIVRDGEGATKFITVQVRNARTFEEAKTVCEAIANSSLIKTAVFGEDANWGRIICAVGYSGVDIEANKVSLNICSADGKKKLAIFKNGEPHDLNEEVASSILKEEEMLFDIDLGLGKEEARMYTCDFSVEYVHINADYRS
ncbi:hypothetical protein BCR36DRAFT_412468 [Piromyces finnis]|uniref:Arginine biosynthesis bifunctional protein ArgJ, mitochondrial n=1 Tax=Piromyces finnis TaxID=1754191 RepID=A0A1Y1V9C7_9FUNG|nr:hypothetical protein BCR36DRAFT_412468 [Piromyces finnis]|eukprot:ORX49969.1 hypothetical protein BCR36DRAFT_412468 [Piromyces finnis]